MDIEDMMVKAIQSYGNDLVSAIAEDIAKVVIEQLGLQQEWGIAVAFTSSRWSSSGEPLAPREELDTVSNNSDSREWTADMLQHLEEGDRRMGFTMEDGRRYLATRISTDWTEDKALPDIDQELAALVADDA